MELPGAEGMQGREVGAIRGLKEPGKRRWERSRGGRQGPGGRGKGVDFPLSVMGSHRGFQAGGHTLVYVSKKITLAVKLPEGTWGDRWEAVTMATVGQQVGQVRSWLGVEEMKRWGLRSVGVESCSESALQVALFPVRRF